MTTGGEHLTARCHLCPETPPVGEIVHHLRVMHPDRWDDGRPEPWPDGEPVIVDLTLEPEDFDAES